MTHDYEFKFNISVSSVVAERPRDAVCPSVVRLNTQQHNTSSAVFHYCYLGFRFITACN